MRQQVSVEIKAEFERTNSARSSITIFKRKTSFSSSVKNEIETVSLIKRKIARVFKIKRISKNFRSKNLVKSFVQSKESLALLAMTFLKDVVYNLLLKQKKLHLFVISLRDIDGRIKKNTNAFTDSKIILSEESHDMIDVFFKLTSDELTSHWKHDHKLVLKEDLKLEHSFLRKMNFRKLSFVKKYLKENLKK